MAAPARGAKVTYFEGGPSNTRFDCGAPSPRSPRVLVRKVSPWTGNLGEDTCLAGAKLIGGMRQMNRRKVGVEQGSVYGAVILMPQLGRSLGWPSPILSLTISAYFYLAFCVILHFILLIFISKEERVMDGFSGQMFLCDFGAYLGARGDHMGPGGTQMTPQRLYGWEQWATRVFARDSVNAVFPHLAANITASFDAGEYGGESWWARIVCCHLFILNIFDELQCIVDLFKLLLFIPWINQTWINIDEAQTKSNFAGNWKDEVSINVAGMSCFWKLINVVVVLVPKAGLWWLTAIAGVNFLMETSNIVDIIVNSVALGFLLSLDDLITETLMSVQANWLLEKCDDFIIDKDEEVLNPQQQIQTHFVQDELSVSTVFFDLMTTKLLKMFICIALTIVFVGIYYSDHCTDDKGRLVGKSLYLPKTMRFTAANFLFPGLFPVDREDTPVWTYSG